MESASAAAGEAVSRLPTVSEACWAVCWAIRLASEEPRLPRPGLVRTVSFGRAVASEVVSAVTEAVKSAGTTSAPKIFPAVSLSWSWAR